MILPRIARHTIGVVAVGARRYIDWIGVLYRSVFTLVAPFSPSFISLTSTPIFARYVALFAWSLSIWIAWNPLIDSRQDTHASPKSMQVVKFIGKLLFGIYLCAGLLLFEKFTIQLIAGKFHERSYAGQGVSQTVHVHLTSFSYRTHC